VAHCVFLECTSTHSSRYNTGIQRAVRNLVRASMTTAGPWVCVPVVYNGRFLEAIGGLAEFGVSTPGANQQTNLVDRLRQGFHLARRTFMRAVPSKRLH